MPPCSQPKAPMARTARDQTRPMTRNLLLLAHIASVAAWLGANILQLVVGPRLRARGGDVGPPVGRDRRVPRQALLQRRRRRWSRSPASASCSTATGSGAASCSSASPWSSSAAITGIFGFDRLFKREVAARTAGDEVDREAR